MAYDEDLANRLRELLADEDAITEKKMFGGLAFLLHGNMAVSASGQGGLLARIDPADTEAALARPHAALMEMGKRSMAGLDPRRARGRQDQARAGRLGQAQRGLREDAAAEVGDGRQAKSPERSAVSSRPEARLARTPMTAPATPPIVISSWEKASVRVDAHDGHQRDHGHDARHGAGGEPQHDQNTTCQIHGQ